MTADIGMLCVSISVHSTILLLLTCTFYLGLLRTMLSATECRYSANAWIGNLIERCKKNFMLVQKHLQLTRNLPASNILLKSRTLLFTPISTNNHSSLTPNKLLGQKYPSHNYRPRVAAASDKITIQAIIKTSRSRQEIERLRLG